jgi:DNA end-binding protein Ku
MAEQLVAVLEDEFRPEEYADDYRDRVMKHIEAKAKGRKPKLEALPKVASEPRSLMDALAASLKESNRKQKEKAVA